MAKIATFVLILAVPGVIALDQRETTLLRTVRGTVVDARGRTLPSSVVYLHHQKTHEVRTHITDANGQYRFSGLHPYGDYEIHAKNGPWTSSVHRLYAADHKRDVVLHLKVDKKEKSKPLVPGDRTNGSVFVVLSPAGLPKNWRSKRDHTSRGVQQIAKYEAADTPPAG